MTFRQRSRKGTGNRAKNLKNSSQHLLPRYIVLVAFLFLGCFQAPVEPPELVSPEDGAEVEPVDGRIVFAWEQAPDIEYAYIEISPFKHFPPYATLTRVCFCYLDDDPTYYEKSIPTSWLPELYHEECYYWRVWVSDDDGYWSDASKVWEFMLK